MVSNILWLMLPVLLAGCSKQIHYTEETYEDGNLTSRTKVKYIGSPGNTATEGLYCSIGDKANPKAFLSVNKAAVDMDKFYEMYTEVSQMMILFMEKYSTKGLVP